MESPRGSLLVTLITVAGMSLMVWAEMPEWQRDLITRAVRHRAHRVLARLARASGRRAMGDELAGRKREADDGYRWTYRLSVTRDRL